jgi:radical SAM enzyme (TIGR01210 family)
MCDLWKNTLEESVPVGAIPEQIRVAIESIGARTALSARSNRPRQIKLYNSGSFFDSNAIPAADYGAIATQVRSFERVIVECHPVLVGESAVRFRDLLDSVRLEIAMGLETVHPEVLSSLNKRMTLEQFARAAEFLRRHNIALRVFILVKPPFLDEAEALRWAKRSIDFAFDCGATAASLIPTRFGNGALEELADRGEFSPPKLDTLEAALDYGVLLKRGRVFADLWDLETFSQCGHCFPVRRERLRRISLSQLTEPAVICSRCS